VDKPHFNLRINWRRPKSSSGDFERYDAVVENTVFGREALEGLEVDVAHGREEFEIVLRKILLSRKDRFRPLKAGASQMMSSV
jgi:hypothetical protein